MSERIELRIYSPWRSLVVIILGICGVPALLGLVMKYAGPALREYALEATLATVLGGGAFLYAALALTRKLRSTGVLRLTADTLELEYAGEHVVLDLKQPFGLSEAQWVGQRTLPLQVVVVSQGQRSWGFSYGLALGKKAYGSGTASTPVGPILDGSARTLHERLRAIPTLTMAGSA